MTPRNLWDTVEPENMVILARAVVDTVREGSEANPGLWKEIAKFQEDFDGTITREARASHFFDIESRKYYFDVFCIVRTKGGWKDDTHGISGEPQK